MLGASAGNIIQLLFSEFIKLILIANIIAWPIAYYGISIWLQHFEYRVDIGNNIFIFTGLAAFFTVLLTVIFKPEMLYIIL